MKEKHIKNKVILISFVVLLVFLGGIFLGTSHSKNSNESSAAPSISSSLRRKQFSNMTKKEKIHEALRLNAFCEYYGRSKEEKLPNYSEEFTREYRVFELKSNPNILVVAGYTADNGSYTISNSCDAFQFTKYGVQPASNDLIWLEMNDTSNATLLGKSSFIKEEKFDEAVYGEEEKRFLKDYPKFKKLFEDQFHNNF